MEVRLISVTKGADLLTDKSAQEITGYITRVSNPKNQENFDTMPKLLKYCIDKQHWSPFEHAYMTVEITTNRAIAAQILRHRSFTFQEFSQRYSEVSGCELISARRQDSKNRQSSIDDLDEETKMWFLETQTNIWNDCYKAYLSAIEKGIAKETARFLLPLNTKTTIYMTGNIRSWIHYIQLRTSLGTQLEHKVIADECKKIFKKEFTDIGSALGW